MSLCGVESGVRRDSARKRLAIRLAIMGSASVLDRVLMNVSSNPPRSRTFSSTRVGSNDWHQLNRVALIGPPLGDVQGAGGIYVNVVRMVESVVEDLQGLQFSVYILGRFPANNGDHAVAAVENQYHSIEAGDGDVVFGSNVAGTTERGDVTWLRSGNRHDLL